MKLLQEELKKIDKLLFLDLEGTQKNHEVIEIGAVLADLDENKQLVRDQPFKQFKVYAKANEPVGNIVTNLTGITEEKLLNEGLHYEDAMRRLNKFIKNGEYNIRVVVFGEQDKLMLQRSASLCIENTFVQFLSLFLIKRIWNYQAFISRFVMNRDNQTMSLLKLMEVFKVLPCGPAHDSLIDAVNLTNLYDKISQSPDILIEKYLELLRTNKKIRGSSFFLDNIALRIIEGETIDKSRFMELMRCYFE